MIRIDQTRFGKNTGNCFEACIASLLHIPIEKIPSYKGPDWQIKCNEWLKREHSIFLMITDSVEDKVFLEQIRGVYHIIGGRSPRFDCGHACVGLGGHIVHDPHPSRDGLKTVEDFSFLIQGDPQIKKR